MNFELHFTVIDYSFPMIYVEGTKGTPYLFGVDDEKIEIHIGDLFISKFPVTQLLWEHLMGNNPSAIKGGLRPVDVVSFLDITEEGGFLEKLNSNREIRDQLPGEAAFRLPTETEWEYAARGGIHWRDNFLFSRSDTVTEVAWQSEMRGNTETHPVGQKKGNQLGIHEMSGNVWEWCQDYFQRDINKIPKDGTACMIESNDRVLRGGCHHNWAIHCTVSKRYEIVPDAKDGCIGFRVALTR